MMSWFGGSKPHFPIKREGNVLVIENIAVMDMGLKVSYRSRKTYTFDTKEEADKFYYIKLHEFEQDPYNFKL